ncbi:MAG: geranyl transferase [Gammaproteobacteria bacterium]|nr:MAG: geranyl transferase [Gammaproteobacteria bacterium]
MTACLPDYQQRFNAFARQQLPHNRQHIGRLYEAVHYSFFAVGGKRLRPALVYAMADSLGIALAQVDYLALAIEAIHTYSLIHDDLPAMDDDDLRRGQPACHKKFDEATAILAGDALNTLAFAILSREQNTIKPEQQLQQIQLLANCAGIDGMVGGQDTDLSCENTPKTITLPVLNRLHQQKTAKLIEACLLGVYLCAESVNVKKYQMLSDAALSLGLFYQIQDDILDVTQSSAILGKPSGSDVSNAKATYVSLLGLEKAKTHAKQLKTEIIQRLQQFFAPDKNYQDTPLASIMTVIMQRQR